jgi:hypothetical protein
MGHPIIHNTPPNIAKAVELTASGKTHAETAKALGCSVSSVKRMLSDPLVKQALAELRAALRVQALQGAQAIVPAAQAWLAEVVKGKTSAKDADALSRALLNLEKVASSASGENREPKGGNSGTVVQIAVAPGWGPPPKDPKVVTALPALLGPDQLED